MLRPLSFRFSPLDPAAALCLGTEAPRSVDDGASPVSRGAERPARPSLDFTRVDYLALTRHPALRAAALAALGQDRLADPVLQLEARIAGFLRLPVAATFVSGVEAIRLTLRALLRPGDAVIVDCAAHPAMFETVLAAGAQLHRSPSGSVEGVGRRLARLARQTRRGRLVVAVPTISAHGSRHADLAGLSELCRSHDALLVADVSQDLGALAPDGGGLMEIQGCLGRVDIVVGSFQKCFGAGGGFAAFRDPDRKVALNQSQSRSAALSAVGASAILAALDIIASPEGGRRRRNLHGLALRLRNHLMADAIKIIGQPSTFVAVPLPALTALPRTALLESAGPRVTLLHAPRVPLHAPRWRIQLNAGHGPADIDDLAELIRDVSRSFDRQSARARVPA